MIVFFRFYLISAAHLLSIFAILGLIFHAKEMVLEHGPSNTKVMDLIPRKYTELKLYTLNPA